MVNKSTTGIWHFDNLTIEVAQNCKMQANP